MSKKRPRKKSRTKKTAPPQRTQAENLDVGSVDDAASKALAYRSTPKPSTLADLAEAINQEHAACENALRTPLIHALEVGRLLRRAKRKVEHGDWTGWIKENCRFSHRTANGYMRLAEKLPKSQPVASIGIREGLNLIADHPFDGEVILAEMTTPEALEMRAKALAEAQAKTKASERETVPVEVRRIKSGETRLIHGTHAPKQLVEMDPFERIFWKLERYLLYASGECRHKEHRQRLLQLVRASVEAMEVAGDLIESALTVDAATPKRVENTAEVPASV